MRMPPAAARLVAELAERVGRSGELTSHSRGPLRGLALLDGQPVGHGREPGRAANRAALYRAQLAEPAGLGV
jgi:hypothetical protein